MFISADGQTRNSPQNDEYKCRFLVRFFRKTIDSKFTVFTICLYTFYCIQIYIVYIEFRWSDTTWVKPNVTQPTDNNHLVPDNTVLETRGMLRS